LAQISTKSFGDWSSAPDPTRGAYSAPTDPLAVFRGSTSKEKKGEEGGGKKREREGSGGRKSEKEGDEGRLSKPKSFIRH